jgi:hypothetical protein
MKLIWRPGGQSTDDGRFMIQKERIRHDGTFTSLMIRDPADQRTADHLGIETGFYGRGAVAKVRAAAQAIADAAEHPR